jgi:DnaJ-class molecular chaperone
MALKIHPDKNKAPKAKDAFRIVSKTNETLTDK